MWSDYFRVLACNLSSLKLISYLDNSFKSYCLARSSDFVGRTKKILLSYDFLKNSSFKPFTKWAKRSFVPAVMFNSSPSTCRSIENRNRSRMNRCDFFFFFFDNKNVKLPLSKLRSNEPWSLGELCRKFSTFVQDRPRKSRTEESGQSPSLISGSLRILERN